MQQSPPSHDMATTAVSRPPPSKLFELDLTVVSAKHLKNVNWVRGDLKPYVILWVDPERRLATKSDDSGSSRPVWNERFVVPLNRHPLVSVLTLEVFHSKPSETGKPLVGTLRVFLGDLADSDESNKLRTFELLRPSGRPHGKIRLKLAIRERIVPDYQIGPNSNPNPMFELIRYPQYYQSPAPAPNPNPTPRDYRDYSPSAYNPQPPPPVQSAAPPPPPPAVSPPLPPPPTHPYMYVPYSDQYSSYNPGYYSQPQPRLPPPPPRPFLERNHSYSMPGPSAPEDYAAYDPKSGGKMGVGAGLGVGAVAGGLGGLTLEESSKFPDRKRTEKVETDSEDYSDYHQAHY